MGGLLLPNLNQNGRRGKENKQDKNGDTSKDAKYIVFTPWRATWDYEGNDHPLKYLILDQKGIQNTSKADWLLKFIAKLQALWIILNVSVRGISGVHVTQLEIATVAFAVMAGMTYLANWWKPKDIDQSTILSSYCYGKPKSPNQVGYYWDWLLAPVKAWRDTQRINEIQRVRNDTVHMTGHVSVVTGLLSVTSLFFGGFHCIAWNFEFPSQAELYCWRIGCVITAVLPATTLGISTVLSHLSKSAFSDLFDEKKSKVTIKLILGDDIESDEWWKHILDAGFDECDADRSAAVANANQDKNLNSDEGAPKRLIDLLRTDDDLRQTYICFIDYLRKLCKLWDRAFRGDEIITKDSITIFKQHCASIERQWEDSKFADFWQDYEGFLSDKLNIAKLEPFQTMACVRLMDEAYELPGVTARISSNQKVMQAARIISIFNGIIYTFARLLTMILLFTSLRATPIGAYEVTPWLTFFPKIS